MDNVAAQNTNLRPPLPPTDSVSGDEQQRLLSILNFWHKIEFFIPFDLDGRISEAGEDKILYLQRPELERASSPLWQFEPPEDEEVQGFRLYLGIFDKSEITRTCNRILGPQNANEDEEFERTALESRSCFARLPIDATGELVLDPDAKSSPVSYVSTLPWALGQFQQSGLQSLTSDRFEHAKQDLAELLLNFKATRSTPHISEPADPARALTHADILDLQELFRTWAGFSYSQTSLVAIVEIKTENKNPEDPAVETSRSSTEPEPAHDETKPDIAILNSFFIEDLESAIHSVKSGRISRTLRSFLSPLPLLERVDLESPAGLRAVLETLHPANMNRGRWLSNADRTMTLMQQFAINTMLRDAAGVPALFSVNGPPGTGKTTLLQDVFADLIVRRARELAKLNKPGDAFLRRKIQVSFKGKQSRWISVLKPELTGCEIVVASSNNAAVETISGDLPRIDKLGSGWAPTQYLRSVAYKIAAQQDDGSFKRLTAAEQPWGLISCALGNSQNRKRFKERFCYMEVSRDRKTSWQTPGRPQHIRGWIDDYQGPDFAAAAELFRQKDDQVASTCAGMESIAGLLHDHLTSIYEERFLSASARVEQYRLEGLRHQRERQEVEAAIERLRTTLVTLREDERLLDCSGPGWWARLRQTSQARLHRARVSQNASAQLRVRRELSDLQTKHDLLLTSSLAAHAGTLSRLEADLRQAEADRSAAEARFQIEKSKFPSLSLPGKLDDLQSDKFHQSGLWNQTVLAQQRSGLFAAALSLHEAWLASVGRRQAAFRQNILAIADLLSGARLEDSAHALPVWQGLFLIVPIVSTTFASFHNQFAHLGPASLGWLFIDEAGQAVPQAAVGALWRARRAVVIGDPLQIEPVFTLPSRFISALAALSYHSADARYSPHKTSVQNLADDSNRFGVNFVDERNQNVWVGSPLRVHRRCLDPMYSWSNEIAYNGKMVFGLTSRFETDGPPIPCQSAWIDIRGSVRNRQEVPEQTQFILELLLTLYRKDRRLPNLYLISPFKAIKAELTKQLLTLDWSKPEQRIEPPRKNELKKWCKERVGTVHTFQGKEEHSVLMILGADPDHAASADWACSKPNILNVALTRAQRRFYLVGDRELWGARGPFAWSGADRFPTISARQFLAIAQGNSALSKAAP